MKCCAKIAAVKYFDNFFFLIFKIFYEKSTLFYEIIGVQNFFL